MLLAATRRSALGSVGSCGDNITLIDVGGWFGPKLPAFKVSRVAESFGHAVDKLLLLPCAVNREHEGRDVSTLAQHQLVRRPL